MPATWTLMAVLIGAWFGTGLHQWWVGYEDLVDALVMPRSSRFRAEVGAQLRPLVQSGQGWRMATGVFLHADPVHLVVNVLSIGVLGRVLEPWLGGVRLIGLFAFGAAVGAITSHVVGIRFTDGSSGGGFAMMGAVAVLAWRRRVGMHPDDRRALGPYLWAFIAANLAISFALPFVNAAGHLGGLGAGVVFGAMSAARPVSGGAR